MDLSALIFVALAVAWAVYLVPKALRHHEEEAVGRSVDSFSDRMRVLARREAVSADRAELVVGAASRGGSESGSGTTVVSEPATEPATETEAETEVEVAVALTPAERRQRRSAAASAARRRRRVLSVLLLATVALVALAAAGVLAWPYAAIPAGLLVAWLVACRLMVRQEQARAAASVRVRKRRRTLADEVLAEESQQGHAADDDVAELDDDTSEVAVVAAAADEPEAVPGGWDPVPVTLPTYVAKAPAGRTVRTIDLDSTGVWSSGRNEADSQLAREAEADSREAAAGTETERKRASGA